MEKQNGLVITFCVDLYEGLIGITPGNGAVFLYKILIDYNLEESTITLEESYETYQNLNHKEEILFQSTAPHRPEIRVDGNLISRIYDTRTDQIIYPA